MLQGLSFFYAMKKPIGFPEMLLALMALSTLLITLARRQAISLNNWINKMQEFQFSEEQIMLRDMTRDFVNNEIKPIAAKIDAEEKIPAELRQKLGELGFLGVSFPEEYGGGGFGEVGYCVMQEKIGAFCLTEAQAGSDSFNVKTRAHLDGDEWVINGEKLWITNGAIADTVSVFARTDKGISAFIVETNLPGYHAGPAEKKMGIKGSTTNAITFDNVRIPKENLIGTEGRAFILAMKTLNAGRLGLGACCIGASKELLEMSVQYSKQRKQFDQTISNFQAIQFMIAEMATMIYAMESMVYRTAIDYDLKKDVSKASAIVKLYCSESLDKIADFAVQIYGGMGYSRELPIERYYRDSRINRIFEGTSEIQKGIIARELLKKNGAM